jgi:hypothetical protein
LYSGPCTVDSVTLQGVITPFTCDDCADEGVGFVFVVPACVKENCDKRRVKDNIVNTDRTIIAATVDTIVFNMINILLYCLRLIYALCKLILFVN